MNENIKVHTLFDLETLILSFFHITESWVDAMSTMATITDEVNSSYLNCGYNNFKRL